MRVLLTAIGSPGDINPVLAVAQALRARGHQATMLVNPYFEPAVRDAGVKYFPLGDENQIRRLDQTAFMRNPARRSGQRELVLPSIPPLLETLDRELRDDPPDLVVYHQLSLGAPWVCERHGVPAASISLSPLVWQSIQDGSVHSRTGCRETPPRWLLRIHIALARTFLRFTLDPALNRIRRRHGYAAGRDFFHHHVNDCVLNLGLWSPEFRGQMSDDPPNGRICGFTWCDRGRGEPTLSDELRDFLDAGEPPIVFTMGTSVISSLGNFYDVAAQACRKLGRRGLLLVGVDKNIPRRLPPGVLAVRFAPHSLVFPRALINVHHGGAGTAAQAMRAGKPTLIVPIAFDQFDNAARLKRLGVSDTLLSDTLWKRPITVPLLTSRLRRILNQSMTARRAAAVGARVQTEDGAARAAALLEESMNPPTS